MNWNESFKFEKGALEGECKLCSEMVSRANYGPASFRRHIFSKHEAKWLDITQEARRLLEDDIIAER